MPQRRSRKLLDGRRTCAVYIEMMRRYRFAALIVVLAASGVALHAQRSPDVNRLMEAIVDSLAVTADAHDVIVKSGTSDIEHLTSTRTAIMKLNQAQQLVGAFAKSPDEMAASAASAFSAVYELLAQLLTQSLAAFETLVRLSARAQDGQAVSNAELAEISIAAGKRTAAIDSTWKMIAEVSALSTSVIVDQARADSTDQHPYLRITAKERGNLRARLARFFPKQVLGGTGGGQHAVQVAPSLIWQFLGKPEWKPADSP
jgi:hypothetical protein